MSASGAGGAAEPEPGSEFAGHRIEAVIGRGGMGVVFRARDLALDLDRALKVLAPRLSGDPRFRDRFRRESRLAASIEHPNVIPVHAAGEESGQLYIAMRLVEGRDLRRLVSDEGALEPGAAARLVAQVAAALDAAHRAGLVHRDVKPANVLVGVGVDAGRVYLTDFGISRTAQAGETVTATGELVGTADFIAPEQIAGDSVDRRADVYALGGVLHFALTGEPPFPRENELATLFAHANAPRPRPSATRPGLPPAFDEVVARAMAVRPEDRYESAGDLAGALTVAAPRPGETTRGLAEPEPERRRRALLIAMALGVTAAIVAVVVIVAGGGEGESDRGGVAASERGDGRGGAGGGESQPKPARVATVKVGDGPIGVTVGEGTVWTAVRGAGEVVGIDPGIEQATSSAGVPTPSAVAVGFGSVWAVTSLDNSLYRLDPAGGAAQRFELGLNPSDVAVDGRWVWVTLEGEDRLVRFDPVDNAAAGEVAVGDGPRAVATGAGAVWVTNIEGGSVSKIDPSEPTRIPNPIEIEDGRPSDIAVGAGRVWAVDVFGGRLIEIEPGAPAAAPRLVGEAVGDLASPRGVKVGFGSVWVATGGDSALLRVDPAEGRVTARVAVGADPADLAIGEGSIWTADEEGNSVTRVDPAQPSP